MKNTTKKKIIISMIIILLLIILIRFFIDTKADDLIEIKAIITDNNGLLNEQNCTITAVNESENGYAITLPDKINKNIINKYYIENKTIDGTIENTENTNNNQNSESTNTVANPEKTNETQEITELFPGEKIYLTNEELENNQITLKVEYDTKQIENNTILYNQYLEKEIDNQKIKITGYMPQNSEISVEKIENSTISNLLQNFINKKQLLQFAYNIKVNSKGVQYKPKDIGEKLDITIEGTDFEKLTNTKLIQIKDNLAEEIETLNKLTNGFEFKVEELNTYAIIGEKSVDSQTTNNTTNTLQTTTSTENTNNGLTQSTQTTEETLIPQANAMQEVPIQTLAVELGQVITWDGTSVATEFPWGNGTESTPYLIADGADLAYLGQQVRNGNTYEGIYFQLANDIDLGNHNWTPIGDRQNSFRGIIDGAGHTIANATINVSSLPNGTYESYGIFATIGGGNTRSIIKNLELSGINIQITASGDTGELDEGGWFGSGSVEQENEGLHIGTLTGTLYKNASITNVIIRNSVIQDTGVINIIDSPFQFAVGGVIGYVGNTYNNNNNPGNGSTYIVDNCYSEVQINLDATAEQGTIDGGWFGSDIDYNGYGQYHTGGIIGTIRGQAVWPTNSLYNSTIDSNGFIGPIFGGLINNSSYNAFNRFATIWNGNDAGNLTANNMYYTNFRANGRAFTQSVSSGNSTQRISNSTNNIGYVQGVNKGIYTNNMNNMLTIFNNNANNTDGYLPWLYENGTFTFKERLTSTVNENPEYTYNIQITDPWQIGNYETTWYKNGVEDTSITGLSYTWTENYREDENMVVVTFDGEYYTISKFTIERIGVDIVFNINENNDSVTASIEGPGLQYTTINDFTFQWYRLDIAGEETLLEGKTSLTLTGLEDGYEYKLVATNTKIPAMSTENSFIYGDRTVIYVDYNSGNNRNDGLTPQTPVKELDTAYGKLDRNGTTNSNVIVIMGTYSTIYGSESGWSGTVFLGSKTSSTYNKPVTITGMYGGVDYNGRLYFYSSGSNTSTSYYRFLTADTNFMYLDWYGNGQQLYFLLQGYNMTIGEGVTMVNYDDANPNQGLLGDNAPAVHIFAGWLQYNERQLPRNNSKIVIKSGAYGRVIGGGTPGTSNGQGQTTSHDFMGSSKEDSFNVEITVDIQNSTKGNYDYDINLFTGGSAAGNNYSNVIQNIKNGSIGRLIGGSIGDSQTRPRNWNYPENTFLGTATINVTGGIIEELYGGCLGRNMGVINQYTGAVNNNYTGNTCDSYFYGTVTINISGGEIIDNIYGAGAGGVTGYSTNSSDNYKNYGQEFDTSVNINITGGTIRGDVYGGGYGYTEYLNANVTADDGGFLYGDSYINISGSPIIEGSIYGAGRGYNYSSRQNLAGMEGTSNIVISGTPTIRGQIFGAGAGVSGYDEMAKLTGTSNININSNLSTEVYGGGNIAKAEGTTNVVITSGTHTGDIYSGGNLGTVVGTANMTINGGNSNRVFAGGNQASVTTTNSYINGGTTVELYGGGNQASVDNTYITLQGGTANTIYGGSNQTGTIQSSNIITTSGTAGTIYGGNNIGGNISKTNITINGGNITEAVYGGGNEVETPETHIELQNSNNEIPNIFGGGNQAGSTTTYINTTGGKANNIYGGSNMSGTVVTSNVTTNGGTIQNVYGGNNEGGRTETPNVTINGQGVVNVYGGGNKAPVNVTNVIINGIASGNVYGGGNEAIVDTSTNVNIVGGTVGNDLFGGGNQAGVMENTNLNISGGTVGNDLFGGGNQGTVTGNTYVHVKNSTINGSVYSGGNGENAIVYGNTNLSIDGTTTNIVKNVFGGGNKAATGSSTNQNCVSTVNIVGATIGGNVYGGANTSVVYGVTQTNIGYDAVGDNSLEKGKIEITGTVFGGGEANADGDEEYDFSFISVTKGIDIQIDGNGYDEFAIYGSIFGSGNASSTSGESYITIKNYGTTDEPQSNISLQRANCATIINSAISLSGATDRTNEYATTFFSISRVNEVKLVNNSTLYLCNGANLLTKLSSILLENGVETKGKVTINEDTGEVVKNVDNRIYMIEGKNLNVATNESVTTYGEVSGMFFFGLFSGVNNPATTTGLYYHGYNNGDTITNEGLFIANAYVLGQHLVNHDITVDGFYTNYNNDGIIKTNYITPTPDNDVYYMWVAGENLKTTTFNVELSASKYITLGTAELLLQGFSTPNVKYIVTGVAPNLLKGVELIAPNQINPIEPDAEKANSLLGLTIESGNSGWATKGQTTFLTENGGIYTGTTEYDKDNTEYTPTFNICLYHSQNITEKRALGDISIRLQVLTPKDDLSYDVSLINIIVTISSNFFQDDFYEGAITPGQKFGLFTTTDTTITNKSDFSVYFSHTFSIDQIDEEDREDYNYYSDFYNYRRALISTDSNGLPYCFPENTKLTMLDMVTNKYYYYIVTPQDVAQNKYVYYLEDFTIMGSENGKYDEQVESHNYYVPDQNTYYENFIFHVSFADTDLQENLVNNTLLMELRNDEGQTLVGVIGIQRDVLRYSVYCGENSTIELEGEIDPTIAYLGDIINLNLSTKFTQTIVDSKKVYDTQYFDDKLGVKLTIYDANGNQVTNDSLFGVYFDLDGQRFYPRVDGTTRIKIADKVTDVLAKLKLHTENNSTLATGDYKIKIESFGSSDGIYYGVQASDMIELNFTLISSSFGLKIKTSDNDKIVENETGITKADENNSIVINLEYSSVLANPDITISLYRRDYSDIYSQEYQLVDLANYTTNTLRKSQNENCSEYEYILYENPLSDLNYFLNLKTELVTGTYKIVYKLYDDKNYIGEAYEYMIIK